MEILFLIGRILLGGYFFIMGTMHFTQLRAISNVAANRNLPAPKMGTMISGLMLIAGGLGVMLGVYVEISLWLLVVFLVVASFGIHSFWSVPEEQKMREKMNFMRNMAYVGALLILIYFSDLWIWNLV